MNTHADKAKQSGSRALSNQTNFNQPTNIQDNRPQAAQLQRLQYLADNGPKATQLKAIQNSDGNQKPPIQLYSVVRGGTCKADQFTNGSGVTSDNNGKLSGVSTQSKDGVDLNTLCGFFRNGQVGVAEDSDITGLGGELVHDGTRRNPNHATINGLTGAELEGIFTPTRNNPNKRTD
jgi:hypothetical protein